jgi:hypothetical protein
MLEDEEEPPPPPEKPAPKPKAIRVSPSVFQNPEAEPFARRVLEGEDITIIPPNQVSSVLKLLTQYRESKINANDVNEAERCHNLMLAIAKHQADSQAQSTHDNRDSHLSDLLEAARARVADLEQRYSALHETILEQNEEHLSELREKHKQEVADFEASWTMPYKTRPFTRASQQLIQLRTRSALLMRARRFTDHRVTERAANDLERGETAERHWRMGQEFDAQRKLMIERHEAELNRQMVSNESRLCAFTHGHTWDLSAAKNRVANLEAELSALDQSEKLKSQQNVPHEPTLPPCRAGTKSGLNMKVICQLKLPPLHAKRAAHTSKSLPSRRTTQPIVPVEPAEEQPAEEQGSEQEQTEAPAEEGEDASTG